MFEGAFSGWELGWQFRAVEDNCSTMCCPSGQCYALLDLSNNEPILEPQNTRNTRNTRNENIKKTGSFSMCSVVSVVATNAMREF